MSGFRAMHLFFQFNCRCSGILRWHSLDTFPIWVIFVRNWGKFIVNQRPLVVLNDFILNNCLVWKEANPVFWVGICWRFKSDTTNSTRLSQQTSSSAELRREIHLFDLDHSVQGTFLAFRKAPGPWCPAIVTSICFLEGLHRTMALCNCPDVLSIDCFC